MSRIIMPPRRRVVPLLAAFLVLIVIFTVYANPTFSQSTSRYLSSTGKTVSDWTRPGYQYLTGSTLTGASGQPPQTAQDLEYANEAFAAGEAPASDLAPGYPPPKPDANDREQTTQHEETKQHADSHHTSISAPVSSAAPDIDSALNKIEDTEDSTADLDKPPPAYYVNYDLHEIHLEPVNQTHYQIEALSSKDGRYVDLDFLGHSGLNPSIIPHPWAKGNYMMVAQRDKDERIFSAFFAEMVCEAIWTGEKLQCNGSSTILPITFSSSPYCDGEKTPMLGMLNMNIGPHDARVFMGPESSAYIMYGSQVELEGICLGQWLQDLRLLTEWGPFISKDIPFAHAQPISRPAPVRAVEKNYFIFWDTKGNMYAHYDLEAQRSFAQIDEHGKHQGNLAKASRATDSVCWGKWFDSTTFANGTHQATNSLSVTLCHRSDPSCKETDDNTFIMTIFQKKLSYGGHAYYLPYVLLFRRTPPFAFYAIQSKPFWVKGQREGGTPIPYHEQQTIHQNISYVYAQHEMLYMTSMNYAVQGRDYHGYLEDVIWLAFGREDTWMAAVDVKAEDLLGDKKDWIMCDDV